MSPSNMTTLPFFTLLHNLLRTILNSHLYKQLFSFPFESRAVRKRQQTWTLTVFHWNGLNFPLLQNSGTQRQWDNLATYSQSSGIFPVKFSPVSFRFRSWNFRSFTGSMESVDNYTQQTQQEDRLMALSVGFAGKRDVFVWRSDGSHCYHFRNHVVLL